MSEPQWLTIAKQLQTIAQAGVTFSKDPFDLDRFEQVRRIAAEIVADHSDYSAEKVESLLMEETGYPCPKVGTRAAVFNSAGEILMVEELGENNKWTLPGGFCDLGDTPSEAAEREVWEETGYKVRTTKLIAIINRNRMPSADPSWGDLYRMLFLCEVVGGEAKPSVETGQSAFFAQDALPNYRSKRRTPDHLLEWAFAHYADPSLPTIYN